MPLFWKEVVFASLWPLPFTACGSACGFGIPTDHSREVWKLQPLETQQKNKNQAIKNQINTQRYAWILYLCSKRWVWIWTPPFFADAFNKPRPDLVNCGRTLFGKLPTRHQQGDLNYFQPIPGKVAAPWWSWYLITTSRSCKFKMYMFTIVYIIYINILLRNM